MGKFTNLEKLIPEAINLVESTAEKVVKEVFKDYSKDKGFDWNEVRWFSDEHSAREEHGIASVYYGDWRVGTIKLITKYNLDKYMTEVIFEPRPQ